MIKRRRNHNTLAKQLLYCKVSGGTVVALLWGQQHETDALQSYQMSLGSGLTVHEVGVFIGNSGFLGASPDGTGLCSYMYWG